MLALHGIALSDAVVREARGTNACPITCSTMKAPLMWLVLCWRYVCACLPSHPSLPFPHTHTPGCVCALAQFLMLGAQTALFMWKKRHQKSYDLVGKGSMACWGGFRRLAGSSQQGHQGRQGMYITCGEWGVGMVGRVDKRQTGESCYIRAQKAAGGIRHVPDEQAGRSLD